MTQSSSYATFLLLHAALPILLGQEARGLESPAAAQQLQHLVVRETALGPPLTAIHVRSGPSAVSRNTRDRKSRHLNSRHKLKPYLGFFMKKNNRVDH